MVARRCAIAVLSLTSAISSLFRRGKAVSLLLILSHALCSSVAEINPRTLESSVAYIVCVTSLFFVPSKR